MPKLELPAIIDNFTQMNDFVCQEAGKAGFNEEMITQIALAFEEAVANVINYAYPKKDGNVEIICRPCEKEKGLKIIIRDQGAPFDPLAKEDPNINAPVEERPIGGLGIFMVKKIMNEVSYAREGNFNILTMVKLLG